MVDIGPIMADIIYPNYGGYGLGYGGYPPVMHILARERHENSYRITGHRMARLARMTLLQQSERLLSICQKVSRRLDTSFS